MKSLLEVQQDIRNLEHSINDITDTIKTIGSDIEDLRTANQNTDIDYSKIELLSKQIMFGKHPIDKLEDGRACQIYLEMLLNMVRMDPDEELSLNRLVFIQWIQKESRIDWSLEALFIDSYKISPYSYHEMVDVIPTEYRENFVVDALIVANICGTANAEIYEYIVGIIAILGIAKERIRLLSSLSRIILCQSFQGVKREEYDGLLNIAKKYKFYFLEPNIFQNCMKKLRKIEVKVIDGDTVSWNKPIWKAKQLEKVKKGDLLFEYESRSKRCTKKIKSKSEGTFYRFRLNNTYYGVVAHENDDIASIKTWVY